MGDPLTDSLHNEISRLNKALSDANGEAAKYRKERAALRKERDRLATDKAQLQADHDRWKSKAETEPNDWKTRAEGFEKQLRARDHRDEWTKVLKDQLADKVTVEKLWEEVKYSPGDQVPTAEQIAKQIGAAREAVPYLFRPAGGTQPADAPGGATRGARPPLKVAIEPSRGAPDTASGRFVVHKSDTRSPAWMRQNRERMNKAREDGTLTFVED